jgi:nucleoid-associated protein YgaU
VAVYIGLAVVLSIVLSLFWLVAVAGLHFVLEYMRQARLRTTAADVVTHALWEIKLDIALVLLALAMALYMNVVLGVLGLQSAARAAAATRITRFAAWERNLRAIVLLGDDVARVIHIGITRFVRRAPATGTAHAAGAGVMQHSGRTVAAVAMAEAAEAERAAEAVKAAQAERAAEAVKAAQAAKAVEAARAAAVKSARTAAARIVRKPVSWRDPWTRGDRFTLGLLAACIALILLAPVLTDHSVSGATLALLEQLHPFPPK